MDRRSHQTEDKFIAKDLLQMKYANNYNAWLFSLLKPWLGKRILEIGCGIGTFTKYFIEESDYVVGIEPNDACAELLLDSFEDEPKFLLQKVSIEESDMEFLQLKKFDTIICMNVLEHIKKDDETLRKFHSLLNNNGNVCLIVPAIPWVYGPIDSAVGHFRRYNLKLVNSKLREAGFQVAHSQYSNFLGLLGWTYNSKIKKRAKQNNFQIKIFDKMVPILSYIEKTIRPPIGLSIIGVGKKYD